MLSVETDIIVSSLTRLEAANVLLGMRVGGKLTAKQYRRAETALAELLRRPPLREIALPVDVCEKGLEQVAAGSIYCRTLDRVHLAAMETLGVRRLVTNDEQQAVAAMALGFEVLRPR